MLKTVRAQGLIEYILLVTAIVVVVLGFLFSQSRYKNEVGKILESPSGMIKSSGVTFCSGPNDPKCKRVSEARGTGVDFLQAQVNESEEVNIIAEQLYDRFLLDWRNTVLLRNGVNPSDFDMKGGESIEDYNDRMEELNQDLAKKLADEGKTFEGELTAEINSHLNAKDEDGNPTFTVGTVEGLFSLPQKKSFTVESYDQAMEMVGGFFETEFANTSSNPLKSHKAFQDFRAKIQDGVYKD